MLHYGLPSSEITIEGVVDATRNNYGAEGAVPKIPADVDAITSRPCPIADGACASSAVDAPPAVRRIKPIVNWLHYDKSG